MPKRPNAYHRPKKLVEALELLSQPDTMPLGGGTTLLAEDVHGAVVDLQDLSLDQIRSAPNRLKLGSTVKLADLAEYLNTDGAAPDAGNESGCVSLLGKAVHHAGPNTYRNAATIGGCVAARLEDSELLGALLVFDAELTLYTPDPTIMTLADYLANVQRPAGLITEISAEWVEGWGRSERVARTPADYPIVSVTFWQSSAGGARLAATGIDLRPLRLSAAESEVASGITVDSIDAAAEAARARARHAGDFRGDAEYRADMVAVLTRRVLRGAGQ